MAIPETVKDLRAMGYVYNDEGKCRGCGAPIEWWITPNGKNFPISVHKSFVDKNGQVVESRGPDVRVLERRVSHFADCPARDQFRKK